MKIVADSHYKFEIGPFDRKNLSRDQRAALQQEELDLSKLTRNQKQPDVIGTYLSLSGS